MTPWRPTNSPPRAIRQNASCCGASHLAQGYRALAAERKVGGIILDSPFTSIADVGAAAYPFAPVRWLIKDPFRSDERIARVRAPLLALHGELDRIVPIRFGEKLFSLAE